MRMLAACSLGGAGHFQPLRPWLDTARAEGFETLVVGPPAVASMVEGTGHPFAAGWEPPEHEVAPIREQLPTAPREVASVLGNRELFGRLATAAMLPSMTDVIGSWPPDLIVRDPCEYASAVVAARSGIPCAQVAIGMADVEWGSIEVAAPALDAHRAGLSDEVRRTPYLSRFPASLDPSPFRDTHRYRERRRHARAELPDWWNGSRAPLVYVSFGTVLGHMSGAAAAYRTVLAAVAGLDARVLLTVGRRFDPASLRDVPANVHVEAWVDQHAVLGAAELVVCHGGSGTTYGALAAGVPVVVWPMFADQFTNARTVAAAGAGVAVRARPGSDGGVGRVDGVAAREITTAIEMVRRDPSYRHRAGDIETEMGAAPTAADVLRSLVAPREGRGLPGPAR